MRARTAVVVIGGVVVGTYREIVTPSGVVRMGTGLFRVAMERAVEDARDKLAIETTGETVG